MPKILATITVIVAALLSPAITLSQETTPMNQDQKAVLATISQMTTAYNAGDIDAVMATYEPGATVMFEPGQATSDTDAVRAMFQGSLAVNPQFQFGEHDVIVQGDIALHSVAWTMTGKTPDGQALNQSGLSVAVLRRQADGAWLMVIDNPHGQLPLEN